MKDSTKNHRIELALADLNQQEKPNILATAKKYQLVTSTLSRRFQGKTVSYAAASSEFKQRLTNAQEEVLIQRINQLTDRGLPPTVRIVRNLAEEVLGGPVGKNWTGYFVKRYKDRLRSLYLGNLDSKRVKAEYAPAFEYFYALVCLF